MRAGWYKIEPYAAVHFFHTQTKSACGIEWRDSKPAAKGSVYCDICKISTGRLP